MAKLDILLPITTVLKKKMVEIFNNFVAEKNDGRLFFIISKVSHSDTLKIHDCYFLC